MSRCKCARSLCSHCKRIGKVSTTKINTTHPIMHFIPCWLLYSFVWRAAERWLMYFVKRAVQSPVWKGWINLIPWATDNACRHGKIHRQVRQQMEPAHPFSALQLANYLTYFCTVLIAWLSLIPQTRPFRLLIVRRSVLAKGAGGKWKQETVNYLSHFWRPTPSGRLEAP